MRKVRGCPTARHAASSKWGRSCAVRNSSDRPATTSFDRPPRPTDTPGNPLGLVALSGVCHEWCLDWEDEAYYARSPSFNPRGPETGTRRVSRGGAWRHQDAWSPVAHRSSLPPALRYSDYGFRVVRETAASASDSQ